MARKQKRAGNYASPLEPSHRLKGEVDAEFTPDRARNEGSVRSKKSGRMPQCRTGNAVAVVVAVVGPVREVEGLGYQLDVVPFAESEVLGQFGVKLEERLSTK